MLGRKDWLPARAEPVSHWAYEATDAQGLDDPFRARLEVTWRVHVSGREPYEFSELIRAPTRTIKGARVGGSAPARRRDRRPR